MSQCLILIDALSSVCWETKEKKREKQEKVKKEKRNNWGLFSRAAAGQAFMDVSGGILVC
jgi:hypothetical protein